MSSAPSTSPVSRGLDRRSVLKAGAWSVPVIAVAVAAPAASASTTANLALLSPQFGSGVPMFTPSLTQRYVASEPVGVVVGNTSGTAYSGPVVMRFEVDRRLWEGSGFTYDPRDGQGERAASFSGPDGCRVAFVEKRQLPMFNSRADDLGLAPKEAAVVSGYNINGGRFLEMHVFTAAGAPK